MKRNLQLVVMLGMMMTVLPGCDEEERLVEMAERQLAAQAEQTRNVTELQREVAKGTRELVEADAKSRQDIVTLHREVQQERAEFGKQRDSLEEDRRKIANQRRWDSLTAASITTGGLLLCCALPLVLCWYLLHRPADLANDHQVVEVLLEDLVAPQPVLLARGDAVPSIEHHPPKPRQALSDESTGSSE